MIMGSSSCHSHHSGPKLENFFGHSYQDHQNDHQQHNDHAHHYMFQNCSTQLQAEAVAAPLSTDNDKTIGLSMIKNWLRSNSNPSDNINVSQSNGDLVMASGNGTLTTGAQTLSLSMSTGSMAGASSGGGGEILSSDNKRQMEGSNSQNGVVEAVVPRKSIDTFGQRTSIYRGVTRFNLLHFDIFVELSMPVLIFRINVGADIDGQEDMRRICGTIAVEEKDKLVKGDKVYVLEYIFFLKKIKYLLINLIDDSLTCNVSFCGFCQSCNGFTSIPCSLFG